MNLSFEPKRLTIEGNASCQLRCPTCPTTGKGYPPVIGSGYLRAADFRKIVESNPRFEEVYLDNRGELFLNPDLLAIMEFAFSKDIPLYAEAGVNLNNVSEKVLEGVVRYKLRSMLCSIDGASRETYGIYRVGGDFDRVIGNIRTINAYKGKYGSDYPRLIWQFVVFGHNEHELPIAKKMARELGMDFNAKMSWDSAYSPIRDRKFVMKETGWPAVTREEFAAVTGRDYARDTCFSLWLSPRINWDGKLLGCCWNSWGEFGGNAFVDGYLTCINGEKIAYARDMLTGQGGFRGDLPCSTCELYLKNRNDGRYIEINEIFARPTPSWRRNLSSALKGLGIRKLFDLIR